MFWKWIIWQAQSYKGMILKYSHDEWPKDTWCTCHACIGHWNCEFDGDVYNTNGDCLAIK